MEITKVEYRSVIKFLRLEGNSPKQIYERLVGVYGDSVPSFSTVTRWFNEFERGRISLEDEGRSGRPSTSVNPDVISVVENLIMEDRRSKVAHIAALIGVSVGSVETIIHEHLKMSKVAARWVPRNLSTNNRHERVQCSKHLLELYTADRDKFLSRVITGDETWIHHYDPESKSESMQWKHPWSPPPRKFRTEASAGKIMATIFWDNKGVLLVDYLPPKTTITGDYYCKILERLRNSIKQKRRGLLSQGVLLLHDNAPAHRSVIAQQTIRDCGFIQLGHPAYSPDLAPSDYYLFRHLKKYLRGIRFEDDEAVKDAVNGWLEGQSADFYFQGIVCLPDKWDKCISVRGDYIEK